jgi:hypothetical protein
MKKVIFLLVLCGFMVTSCGKVLKASNKIYKYFQKGARTERSIAKKKHTADLTNTRENNYNIRFEDESESDKSSW